MGILWRKFGASAFWKENKGKWLKLFPVTPSNMLHYCLYVVLPKIYVKKTLQKTFVASQSWWERQVIRAFFSFYYSVKINDHERLKLNQSYLWGGKASRNWHRLQQYTVDEFLKIQPSRRYLLDELKKMMSSRMSSVDAIVEIGTGRGTFLHCLSKNINRDIRFIGLDICSEQIEDNKKLYEAETPKLEFKAGSFQNILIERIKSFVIVFCGTLEYFTPSEFEELMKFLQKSEFAEVIIALVEPTNLNLPNEIVSRERGNSAFSHNYSHMMRTFGFDIISENLRYSTNPKNRGTVNVELLASRGPCAS